jgi:hypothetical protein
MTVSRESYPPRHIDFLLRVGEPKHDTAVQRRSENFGTKEKHNDV